MGTLALKKEIERLEAELSEAIRKNNDLLFARLKLEDETKRLRADLVAEKEKYAALLEKYIDMMEKTTRINEPAPDAVKDIFDLTVYFQNSCDQDYDFEDWRGIPIFEAIAEKWENASDSEVEEYYNQRYPWKFDKDECSDYDYYRRSYAYDEIWRMCETYLYHEEKVVYISMFGGYEISEQTGFVNKCRKAYDEWNRRADK